MIPLLLPKLVLIGQELGKEGNKARYGSGSEQATEFAPFDESGNIQPDSTRAKSSSVGPNEVFLRTLTK